MLEELDFTKEADNLIKFRSFLSNKGLLDATAPLPYLFASGKRVLTMYVFFFRLFCRQFI